MARGTDCPQCPHERRSHDRNGCAASGCSCKLTYMDLAPPDNPSSKRRK